MRVGFKGNLIDEPEIRAGFIGCGSHAFRNILPTFQFAPVRLVSTCDLSLEKAQAFAAKFGAAHAFDDYHKMLLGEKLDAVFIAAGYDDAGRPVYPRIAVDCLKAGCHVWMEKPPAASCEEIDGMREAAKLAEKQVMVGLKKMFFPANRKAKLLSQDPKFGKPQLVTLQYPQHVPTPDEFDHYLRQRKHTPSVQSFLDHLCHPASLLIYLLGMPSTLSYQRAANGASVATFTFASGAVGCLLMTQGASANCGMERTTIVSDKGQHIIVDNNIRVQWRRPMTISYGDSPDYFAPPPSQAALVWEPEFSLGQLYNKGLFLLGYYDEINEFARAILEHRSVQQGTLDHAWQVTRIFRAFSEGAGKVISLV